AAILKTFGGNEATKKTKKNILKQQYGNFKVEGSETLEQTFNRLQVIISQLQFMDVEIEQDDLNQKFLTSLAPEWLMHTIVWRNMSDLDTMSLDDLYNHLKVYESEVQKKSETNSQNMAFISSAKHSRGNEEVNTASVSTASTNVPTASANIGVVTIRQDTTCAYIASQFSGSQIKFEDINQIDEDDMKEMDIKWNMALLSMRADRFWKKTWKKISIQGANVAGFDKSKVECFNCHKMGHFAREGLEFKTESSDDYIEILKKELELIKKAKEGLDSKLTCFQTASKHLDSLLESQRLDKNKEGLGYSVVPPHPAQIYSLPKKDISWTSLPEFKDDTVTDYSRPAPTVESSPDDWESIESYYHRFLKLMNDLKINKHFPEKIASNLKFLNNLQLEWSRHVTIVHQTKDLHTTDYTQLYDFLKYNQKEVDELKAERIAKIQDPLALMANSSNPYASPAPNQDQSSFNQNLLQQPMTNPEDITDPTTAMNMALALMAKAFKLNYSTPTNNNQRISSNPRNRQIAQPGMNMGQDRQMQMIGGNGGNQFRQYAGQNAGNLNGYNEVQNVRNQVAQNPRVQNVGTQNGLIGVQGNGIQNQIGNGNIVAVRAEGNAAGQNANQIRCYNCRGFGHYTRNCTARPRRRDAAYLQTQLLIAQKEEAGIQLQAEEYDLMAAATDLDEIKEVNANCILMANLQQA
nr:hypothetical protein [Tanacetum cinerariifolium]